MRVFEKLPLSENLKMFRESLRLFIQIFLLKNLKDGAVPEDKKNLLKERAQMVEKLLTRKARWQKTVFWIFGAEKVFENNVISFYFGFSFQSEYVFFIVGNALYLGMF